MKSGRPLIFSRSRTAFPMIAACLAAASGCAHSLEPVTLDLTHGPLVMDDRDPLDEDEVGAVQDPGAYLATLRRDEAALIKATGKSDTDRSLVSAIVNVIRAEMEEVQGNLSRSTEFWRAALRASPGQGQLAKSIFDQWARHITRHAKPGTDAIQVARQALDSTGGGRDFQYLIAQGLLSDIDLARRLYQFAPERLTFAADVTASGADDVLPPSNAPATGTKNPDDPLLAGALRQACAARLPNRMAAWEAWAKPLTQPWSAYWSGVMADCKGLHGRAVELFRAALAHMDQDDGSDEPDQPSDLTMAALRLELQGRLIKSRRALGERESLSDDYKHLMAAWRAPGLSARNMGLNPAVFALRRIDDTIWSARQRSLSDDLEGAELLAREAIDLINRAFPDPVFVAANYRKELANLRCEVLHFLAFRIAWERREWTQAALLTEDALQTIPITAEWTRRLQSHAVLYDFSAGQMALARRRLEQMLSDAPDDSTRAFSLFWLARVFEQMGQKTESDFYLRSLIQEQPLSYYSVVAAPAAGLVAADSWTRNFGDLETLRARLRMISLPDAADLGTNQSAWGTVRRRAEILVSAGISGRWARSAVAEAVESAWKISRPDRSPEAFLYLSRLAYSAGDYARAIELTTVLSSNIDGFWTKYPEQIFIVYPFPRLKTFSAAAGTGTRMTLMLGLARQESSFRPDAQSPARAFGYMQLTAATARRIMGPQAPGSDDTIEAMLLDPQMSIRLSARYIEQLNQNFRGSETLVAAAYNAGEFAVLNWRKRRESDDQTLFIESIPYGETKGYVKAVLRNAAVYRRLLPLTRESLAGNKKDP